MFYIDTSRLVAVFFLLFSIGLFFIDWDKDYLIIALILLLFIKEE